MPVLDYASIKEYADSIQEYVDNRLINAPQTVIISTQPLDADGWQPVPFLQLLVYREGRLLWQGTHRSQQFYDKEKDWEYKNFDYSSL